MASDNSIPEVVDPSMPGCPPTFRDFQQPPNNKYSRELRQDYPKEPTIEELQIRALKRAMSILDTHIADSKERVVEIRTLLAERDIEPSLYKNMQRQRWMEEKRQIATSHLSKIVEQHLNSPPATSSTTEGGAKLGSASRSTMNLVMFFESPRQRVSTSRTRVRRNAHMGPRPDLEATTTVPSVHHHRGVIPLVLKPSPHVPLFLKNRVQVKKSDDSTVKTRPTSQALSVHSKHPASDLAQLATIAEIPESTRGSQVQILARPDDANGSAIIWRNSPRTTEEILSELIVDLPNYVDELLAEFDTHSFTPMTPLNAPQESKSSQLSSPQTPSGVNETPRPQRTLGVPVHIHKSPSRKRISALFSLADAISPRKVPLVSANSSDRARRAESNTAPTPPTLASTSVIPEESGRPFSVSFSALPSSESGGSREQEAEYSNNKRASRLGHRLSFFKRH